MLTKNIERIKFQHVTSRKYSKIDINCNKYISDLPKLLKEKITIETKEAIGHILEYVELNKIDGEKTKISDVFKKILKDLKRSDNEKLKFLCIQLLNLERIRKLQIKSITDCLTGLNNRSVIKPKLESLTYNYEKNNSSEFSIIIIDIDFFKKVNDTFGHTGGDIVLKEIANILKEACEETGEKKYTISRWGGEEFFIILEGENNKNSLKIAKKIRKQIKEKTLERIKKALYNGVLGKKATIESITCSIGVATVEKNKKGEVEGENHLIKKADTALYKAKQTGRDKVCNGNDNGDYKKGKLKTLLRNLSIKKMLRINS